MPSVHGNKLRYPQNYSLKTSALREILNIWKEFAFVVSLRFLSEQHKPDLNKDHCHCCLFHTEPHREFEVLTV